MIYELSTMPASIPTIDMGDPLSVMKRSGCTMRGSRQKEFVKEAHGRVAIRLNHIITDVPMAELDSAIKRINKLEP